MRRDRNWMTTQWRAIFMAGWDACISGRANPYRRADYRAIWAAGFARCERGEGLPQWYPEFSTRRLHARHGTVRNS
jgi:hypothetical protein